MKIQPTHTAFDLLEGAFAKVRRARLVQLIAIGLAAAACIGVASQVVVVRFATESLAADQETTEDELAELTQLLSQEADTRGLNRSAMENYLARFGEEVAEAAQLDAPVANLFNAVDQATPPQVEVSKVSIEAGSRPVRVTVGASTEGGYTTALDWREALVASPLIAEVEESWSGAEGDLSLTMEMTLTAQAGTSRAERYIDRFTLDGELDLDDSEGA